MPHEAREEIVRNPAAEGLEELVTEGGDQLMRAAGAGLEDLLMDGVGRLTAAARARPGWSAGQASFTAAGGWPFAPRRAAICRGGRPRTSEPARQPCLHEK